MSIRDIYRNTARFINLNIKYEGSAVDISGDEVLLMVKAEKDTADSLAIISTDADVVTSGSIGRATFYLTNEITNVEPGYYYVEVQWERSTGDKYVLVQSNIQIKDRVFYIS